MSVPIAPRIDLRLREHIANAPKRATAAEVTRAVGDLAWTLGLRRPSYQQVRVLRSEVWPAIRPTGSRTIDMRVVFRQINQGFAWLTLYPGFGLSYSYRQKYHRRT